MCSVQWAVYSSSRALLIAVFDKTVIDRLRWGMISVKALPEFTRWLDGLADDKVKAVVAARVRRLSFGLPGDVSPVGEGVSELRIHLGAGWRVYFVQRGAELIVLLAGGSKKSQAADIRRAKALAKTLE
ncbi:hypothetical protein SDC9_195709 [bioreactor metagenome]|uniref:Addiction module killer protein n=1 Tax=bioreactor metagenome TaxID=1076179 RepID=A0A645I9S8_9ZZZZ